MEKTSSGTVDTISLDSDTILTFDGMVTVDTIDGDGTMRIAAGCAITAVATPTAVSDTNAALSVKKGSSYIMKVTASATPSVVTGTNGVFTVTLASKNGNEYFYKLSAVGPIGSATGI